MFANFKWSSILYNRYGGGLMFPTQEVKLNKNTQSPEGKVSFNYDFSTGDFVLKDGRVEIISGLEAIKMWIIKVLKTEKHKFRIYNSNNVEKYGVSLSEIITSDYPIEFIKSEIQREIKDTLIKNSEIKEVSNFVFNRDRRTLNVTFNVKTSYGTIRQEVVI